jgi:hypothetical protein
LKINILEFFPASKLLPEFASSHLQVPTPIVLDNGLIRVYFATRDVQGRSHTSFLEIDESKGFKVVYIHQSPVMELGKPGTFDADGVMVNQVIQTNELGTLLLYTGWSKSTGVPYKTMAGIAVSKDGGISFNRISDGPFLGIDQIDPLFVNTPFLLQDKTSMWQLFYASGIKWHKINERMEPQYQIKRAKSKHLQGWQKNEKYLLPNMLVNESNVRPWIVLEDNEYTLFYSYRGTEDFRDGNDAYKIALSRTNDFLTWTSPELVSLSLIHI